MHGTARSLVPLAALLAVALAGCTGLPDSDGVRLGYFPNVTHAQALYGIQAGVYARALDGHGFSHTQFNAGPTALEALLGGQVDATYVGPSPLINALAATGGDVLRVIAGSASGGARFILRGDVHINGDADLRGKTFASPQLGNTQDVSLKDYLRQHGHATEDRGGDVKVVNAQNPDILALFAQKQVDGAWVPEPWATRLVMEGGGRELLDERTLWPDGKFATTVLVTTAAFAERRPDLVRGLLEAHVEATQAVAAANASTLRAVNDALKAVTGKPLPDGLLAASFTKINFTTDPLAATLEGFAGKARGLGLLRGDLPPFSQVTDLGPLNEVLARHGKPGVPPP